MKSSDSCLLAAMIYAAPHMSASTALGCTVVLLIIGLWCACKGN